MPNQAIRGRMSKVSGIVTHRVYLLSIILTSKSSQVKAADTQTTANRVVPRLDFSGIASGLALTKIRSERSYGPER